MNSTTVTTSMSMKLLLLLVKCNAMVQMRNLIRAVVRVIQNLKLNTLKGLRITSDAKVSDFVSSK